MSDIKKEAAWKDYNYETLGAIAGGLGVPLFDRYVLGNKRGALTTLGEALGGAALGYGGGALLRQGVSTSGQTEKLKSDIENSPKTWTTERVMHGTGGAAAGLLGGDFVGKRLANIYTPPVDAPTRPQVVTDYEIAARAAQLNQSPENKARWYDAAAKYKQFTGEMPPGVVSNGATQIKASESELRRLNRDASTIKKAGVTTPKQQKAYKAATAAVAAERKNLAQLKEQAAMLEQALAGINTAPTSRFGKGMSHASNVVSKVTGGIKGGPNLRRTALINLARGGGMVLGGKIGFNAPDWLYDSPDNMAEQVMNVAESVKNLPPPQRDAAMSEFLGKAGRGYTPEMRKDLFGE